MAGVLVACLLLSLAALPASAFRSLPPGTSVHDEITAQAGAAVGVTGKGLEALQQAVRRPDVDEMTVKADGDTVLLVDASIDYEPSHHCDRVPPVNAADALTATGMYVRLQSESARQQLVAGHAERSLRALGNAVHALQDCFSHSNVGDLSVADQDAFLAVLLEEGASPPPASLLLCSFQPGLEDPEMPPGDPYSHGAFNKDAPKSTADAEARLPDGRTKHEAAYALAVDGSKALLSSFFASVTPQQKAALLALEAEATVAKTPGPGGAATLVTFLAVAAIFVARRRSS